MILDYNFGKKGVDQFDQNIEEYACRRKTVRWPLLVFYNLLDVAAYNGFIMLKNSGYQFDRKSYLKKLARVLVR